MGAIDWDQWAAATRIGFVLAFVFGFVLISDEPGPAEAGTEVAGWLASERSTILTAAIVFGVAIIFLVCSPGLSRTRSERQASPVWPRRPLPVRSPSRAVRRRLDRREPRVEMPDPSIPASRERSSTFTGRSRSSRRSLSPFLSAQPAWRPRGVGSFPSRTAGFPRPWRC